MNNFSNNASLKWSNYYKSIDQSQNYYPESFVHRVFSSKKPVQFINDEYVGKSILDLGCGHGRNIPFLSSLGLILFGLEVSDSQVSLLKSIFPDFSFFKGTNLNIPIKDSFFDYVLACNSIYYIDDINKSFSDHLLEVKRVLKKNGVFVLSMLGKKHSIFKNSTEIKKNYFHIEEDFLNFRNGVYIRQFDAKTEDPNELFSGFKINSFAEISESVQLPDSQNSFNRHLYYFVLIKL